MLEDVITKAINNKQILEFNYKGNTRIVEPYVVGETSKGKYTLLSIQTGGYSSSGKLPDWRMFELDKIEDLQIRSRSYARHFHIHQTDTNNLSDIAEEISNILCVSEERLTELYDSFEHTVILNKAGTFWGERTLKALLGYTSKPAFKKIVERAKEVSKDLQDTFIESKNKSSESKLSIHACQIIANLADPRKEQVLFARIYFTIKRIREAKTEHSALLNRLHARFKLSAAERQLSSTLYKHGVDEKGFSRIRSIGDNFLFGGYNTARMKKKLDIRNDRSIADFLPTILLKAKEFAATLTDYKVQKNHIHGVDKIGQEHVRTNNDVRAILVKNKIYPEENQIESDIRTIEKETKSLNLKKLN
jgi:DNA-damage-inducible protein D